VRTEGTDDDSDLLGDEPPRSRSQVWKALARFAAFGFVALLVVLAGNSLIAERVSRGEVLRHSRQMAIDIALKLIAPRADDALRQRDPEALRALDTVMQARMTDSSLLRVKVWSQDGVILWSDEKRLVGQRFELEPKDEALLTTPGSTAEFTALERPENAYEAAAGEAAEVYVGFRDDTGEPLLLELYVPVAGLAAESQAQARTLFPLTVGGPALLLLILLPLALSMARRVDDAGAERATLLRHAVAASALERRRIAGDLHDGVVQDLAGIGYAMPAIRETLPEGPDAEDTRNKLDRITDIVQRDVAALRSVITDIYPPDLQEGGLVSASQLLFNEARYAGVDVDVDVDPTFTEEALPIDAAVLGYRVLRETLRNVVKHSGAAHARVVLRTERGDMVIEVSDDGVGFDPATPAPKGHFGIRLLQDTLKDVGGELSMNAVPEGGTRVVARFPVRWGSST
jgi:signal transduction histidine kinase